MKVAIVGSRRYENKKEFGYKDKLHEVGAAPQYKKFVKSIDKQRDKVGKETLKFVDLLRKKGLTDAADDLLDSYKNNVVKFGVEVNFMVPLDSKGLQQCRDIAKRQEEKMRLDYELVRALKCAELRQRGFTFHPQSEMVVLCQDVVPISALQPPKPKKKLPWQK